MAAPREGSLLLIALLSAGCRGTPPPVVRAEQTPPAAPVASPVTTTPAPPAKDPSRDDAPVVVDPGDDESSAPKTLAQAARAEKERRARAGAPAAIVINDRNLHQYAAKGQITVADPKTKEKKAATVAPATTAADPAVHDEQYWRSQALEIRLHWRAAADEVKKLEQRSTELRQRFYSENDSFVRDNQVKPEWDRVTDRLQKVRADIETARQQLATFLDEGRRAGALPGWLREGEEQEPPAEPVKKKNGMPAPQSIEPPVLNNPDDGRPPAWR
ncbi:MAG TPA: hypothetical protein VIA62_13515 [Thermoanaerobaculia bacterium]|jgi:hypothetical protein|nr:hypothetical protein [Thermoanaerobaculia bacterium]